MAIILGQREEFVSLKAQLMIVTKCVEDLGRHCVDQQAQIVSMTENMVTMDNMEKIIKIIAEIKKEVAEFSELQVRQAKTTTHSTIWLRIPTHNSTTLTLRPRRRSRPRTHRGPSTLRTLAAAAW